MGDRAKRVTVKCYSLGEWKVSGNSWAQFFLVTMRLCFRLRQLECPPSAILTWNNQSINTAAWTWRRKYKMKLPNVLRRCQREFRTFSSSASRTHREKPPFNILFFGTDSFAVKTLQALHTNRFVQPVNMIVRLFKSNMIKYACPFFFFLLFLRFETGRGKCIWSH